MVFLFILVGLDLENGAQYIILVRAVNFAGLQIEATSDGFTVDFTPPVTSEARIGTGLEPAKYLSDRAKMIVRYRFGKLLCKLSVMGQ